MTYCMRNEDWTGAVIHFNACNALFPDDYTITVNTVQYDNEVSSHRLIQCSICNEWQEYGEIEPYEIMLNSEDRLILLKKNAIVWDCLKCKETQLLQGAERKKQVKLAPFYIKIVPEPPAKHGLGDRLGYKSKMRKWCDIAYQELEHQVSKYRTDYAAQQDKDAVPLPDQEPDS